MAAQRNRTAALAWTSGAVTTAALVLYVWTVRQIARFHPDYPEMVTLGPVMPPTPVHIAHSLFPVALLVTSAVVAFIVLRGMRAKNATLVAHCVVMLAFIACFLWAALWSRNARALAERVVVSGTLFVSQDFCFRAWFPGPPLQTDDDRVTKAGIKIRGRNFSYSDGEGALIVTAVKFPADSFGDSFVPTYLDGAIQSHVRSVAGELLSVTPTEFLGMPARTFVVRWAQEGSDWQSTNVISYANGHSFTVGVIHPAEKPAPGRGETFFRGVSVDANCIGQVIPKRSEG